MVAVLIPQFLLAKEVDGDEFAKATGGIALAGVIVAAYKVYVGAAAKREATRKFEAAIRNSKHDLGIGGLEDGPEDGDLDSDEGVPEDTVDLLEPLRKPPEFYDEDPQP